MRRRWYKDWPQWIRSEHIINEFSAVQAIQYVPDPIEK